MRKRANSANLSVALLPQGQNVDSRRQHLVSDLRQTIGPRNSLERLWVEEIADLTFEIDQYRRLKNRYLKARQHDGVKAALAPVIGPLQAGEVATQWLSQKTHESAPQAGAGLTLDPEDIAAYTMVANLETVERLERLMATAEARRALALQQLERFRAGPLARPMSATRDIEARASDDSNSEHGRP